MRSGSSHNGTFYSRDKVGWLIESIAALGQSPKGQLEGWIEPWKIEIDSVKADLAKPVSNVQARHYLVLGIYSAMVVALVFILLYFRLHIITYRDIYNGYT